MDIPIPTDIPAIMDIPVTDTLVTDTILITTADSLRTHRLLRIKCLLRPMAECQRILSRLRHKLPYELTRTLHLPRRAIRTWPAMASGITLVSELGPEISRLLGIRPMDAQ